MKTDILTAAVRFSRRLIKITVITDAIVYLYLLDCCVQLTACCIKLLKYKIYIIILSSPLDV